MYITTKIVHKIFAKVLHKFHICVFSRTLQKDIWSPKYRPDIKRQQSTKFEIFVQIKFFGVTFQKRIKDVILKGENIILLNQM